MHGIQSVPARRNRSSLVWRRWAVAALTVSLTLGATSACGDDDDPNDPGGSVAGTYSVVRVNNDQSAPYLIAEGTIGSITFRAEVMSGTLTLRSDNTYSGSLTIRLQTTGQPDETDTQAESGTYSVSGNTITFDPSTQGEPNYSATRNGNDITYSETDDDGNTFTITFRK